MASSSNSHPTDMCNLFLQRCLFTFFFANFELNYRFCERGANLENLKSKLFKVLSCQVQGHAKKMNVNCEKRRCQQNHHNGRLDNVAEKLAVI